MSPQMMNLLARVDGLPVALITPERIWPAPQSTKPARPSARTRERQARQTLVVHHAPVPAWARELLTDPVEDVDVHADLQAAGLL